MKKVLILCVIALILVGGVVCLSSPGIGDKTPYNTVNDFPGASLKVIEVFPEEQKVTVEYSYSGENELIYGSFHKFEVLQDGEWYTLELRQELTYPDIGYVVENGQTKQETYGWAGCGRLSAGRYRIVVETNDFVESGVYTEHVLAAEFDIE